VNGVGVLQVIIKLIINLIIIGESPYLLGLGIVVCLYEPLDRTCMMGSVGGAGETPASTRLDCFIIDPAVLEHVEQLHLLP
jgi:hypothetical protein